jgi:hypothetical protein
MPITEDRKKYLSDYRKKNLKRIPLDVSPEMYEDIKRVAKDRGLSVNGWLKTIIAARISEHDVRNRF